MIRWSIETDGIVRDVESTKKQINPWTHVHTVSIDDAPKIRGTVIVEHIEKAWYLDGERRLREIERSVIPPFPVGCWFVVRDTHGSTYQIDLPKYPHMKFQYDRGTLSAEFPIKDVDAIGLPFWGEEKLDRKAHKHHLEVRIYKIGGIEECAWIEPWPNGAKAVICLTDHADWDSTEKLRQLADLFERNDFRFTKSVFPHSDPQGSKQEPGLDDPEFRRQVDRLAEMGTEIAYHGFSPRIKPPSFEAVLERMKMMEPYRPKTWIDHGTGSYLYSRNACFDNGVRLVDLLEEQGIENFWSYRDLWENPALDLNVWSRRKLQDTFVDIGELAEAKGKMSLKQFAYLAAALPKNLFGGSEYRKIKSFYRPDNIRFLAEQARKMQALHRNPMAVYTESGDFALEHPDQRWVFDTILLNHLSLQLAPKAVDRLAKDNGVLIAHCYMGAQHPYGGSNCFHSDQKGMILLLGDFSKNIEHIAMKQRKNELITLTFERFRKILNKFLHHKKIYLNGSWKNDPQNISF